MVWPRKRGQKGAKYGKGKCQRYGQSPKHGFVKFQDMRKENHMFGANKVWARESPSYGQLKFQDMAKLIPKVQYELEKGQSTAKGNIKFWETKSQGVGKGNPKEWWN